MVAGWHSDTIRSCRQWHLSSGMWQAL